MKIRLFYHSLLSDWNHGNAHFLRGIACELIARGHDVLIYEPCDGWSLQNLRREQGEGPIHRFALCYPQLRTIQYDPDGLDLDKAMEDADLVIVHEWNDPELVHRIGRHRRRRGGYRLLFHDTHHRAVTAQAEMKQYDLTWYDGVLAFGEVLRELYLKRRWTRRAWTWHESADTRMFKPRPGEHHDGDVVWIGNWGDDERTAELREFLLKPASSLGMTGEAYGVRYPDEASSALGAAGIRYRGWIANYAVPRIFSRFKLTLHIPRRPYVEALPGIPTIRIFEALACGIPLICSRWRDAEHLFSPGSDYLIARDGEQMKRHMRALVNEPGLRRELAEHGRRTVLARHTCAHRVDELLEIYSQITAEPSRPFASAARRRRAKLRLVT